MKYKPIEISKKRVSPDDAFICAESDLNIADLKITRFKKYKNKKNILTSELALIFLSKLNIMTNIPVIIKVNKLQ